MDTPVASVTLTSKHQLTVPAKMVRALKLRPGDKLVGSIKNGAIVLRPRPSLSDQLAELNKLTVGRNKGVATDESMKESIREYYRNQPRP